MAILCRAYLLLAQLKILHLLIRINGHAANQSSANLIFAMLLVSTARVWLAPKLGGSPHPSRQSNMTFSRIRPQCDAVCLHTLLIMDWSASLANVGSPTLSVIDRWPNSSMEEYGMSVVRVRQQFAHKLSVGQCVYAYDGAICVRGSSLQVSQNQMFLLSGVT